MLERTQIKIRIVQLGKKVFYYEGPPESTVGEALKTAGVNMDHLRTDLRLNGEAATEDTILHDSDIITVIPPIKGGSLGLEIRLAACFWIVKQKRENS